MRVRVVGVCLFIVLLAMAAPEGAKGAIAHEATAYRVRADERGVLVETREGGSVSFEHPRVVTSRTSWAPRIAAPTKEGDLLSYDHGAWKEQFVLRPDALQQMFLLREPIREEASIRIPTR